MARYQWVLCQCVVFVLCLTSVGGCSGIPPARPFYQDAFTSIRLQQDDHVRKPHAHPAQVSPEVIAQVMRGTHVISRQGFIKSLLLDLPEQAAAFSSAEIYTLAPKLSKALTEAKPDELVTFYRRISDEKVGLAITSGGLFVHGQHLYFVLANDRTTPASGMNINRDYALDPIDTPLLPIDRADFKATFTPATALVREEDRIPWPYIDDGRVLAIDLPQLARDSKQNPSSQAAGRSSRGRRSGNGGDMPPADE